MIVLAIQKQRMPLNLGFTLFLWLYLPKLRSVLCFGLPRLNYSIIALLLESYLQLIYIDVIQAQLSNRHYAGPFDSQPDPECGFTTLLRIIDSHSL
jgi:hypothetical protein